MKQMTIAALLVSISGLGTASNAKAYRYRTCDGTVLKLQGGGVLYEAGTNSFASDNRRHSLLEAMRHWVDAPMEFVFLGPDWDRGVSSSNRVSEVWYSDDEGLLDDRPAVAMFKTKCNIINQRLDAVDIVMDNDTRWMHYTKRTNHRKWRPNGGGYRPAQTTLMHELGHALGLMHSNVRYNLMGADTEVINVNDGEFQSYTSEDPSKGVAFIHGTENDKPDLAVSPFKYNGKSGEYSTHIFSKVYNEAGTLALAWQYDNSRREYFVTVARGFKYKFEFTYEHLGPGGVIDTKAGYYLSTNERITTSDWFLEDRNFSLGWNVPYTGRRTIRIPANAPLGRRYLGVIIDYQNTTNERRGSNNRAYIAIEIVDN